MREATVINGLSSNAQNVARLYQHLVNLDARNQAFERVLSSRKAFLVAILSPSRFWGLVTAKHRALMADHERQVQQYAEEQKKEAMKPKLTMVRP